MNSVPTPENPDLVYHAFSFCVILFLIGLFMIGAWIRTFIVPPKPHLPVKFQLIASLPVGIVTMALYSKSAIPTLSVESYTLAADVFLIFGYALAVGMLSRETLDRVMNAAQAAGHLQGAR